MMQLTRKTSRISREPKILDKRTLNMNPKRLVLLVSLAFALAGQSFLVAAETSSPREVKYLDAAAAAEVLTENPDVVVLDVRTPGEFSSGHIKGAVNVDFYTDDFEATIGKLATDKTYLVHCASGGRSSKALATLSVLGFESVIHLDGGFNEWERTGQPVER